MTQRVTTQFGVGRVTDEQTVRGVTSYKVEGAEFSLWLTAAQIPEFGQLEWEGYSHTVQDNSTTLPYNPAPQFYNHDDTSTIQPNHHLDIEKRLSPSDSVDFSPETRPAFAPHLFAGRETLAEATEDMTYDSTSIDDEFPGGTNTPTSTDDYTPSGVNTAALFDQSELSEIQARLGDKFADIPVNADHDSVTARLTDDPYRVVSEVTARAEEKYSGVVEDRVAQQMHLEASDGHLRTAAWADVRAKGVRLRGAGQVETIGVTPESIYAYVEGDHDIYETIVVRGSVFTGSGAITEWDCNCLWGHWAFKRMTYTGRLCSHAYAAYLEMQSQHRRKDKGKGWYASLDRTADVVDEYKAWCSSVGADPNDVEALQDYDYEADLSDSDSSALTSWANQNGIFAALRSVPDYSGMSDDEFLTEFDAKWPGDISDENADEYLEWEDELVRRNLHDAAIDAARHAEPSGELSVKPGTLTPELNFVPSLRERRRVDVTAAELEHEEREAFLSEPFEGSGPNSRETFPASHPSHGNDDVEGPGDNPALSNGDDVVLAGAQIPEDVGQSNLDYIAGYYGREAASTHAAATEEEGEEFVAASNDGDEDPLAYLMGSNDSSGNDDIAAAAEAHLATLRVAGRQFSMAEQQALIDEDAFDGVSVDQGSLDLKGTHYLP